MNKQTKLKLSIKQVGLAWLSLLFSNFVFAIDYQSVAIDKAILYDQPSTSATKVMILGKGYPVEVIVSAGEWVKVRDHAGKLHWMQAINLTSTQQGIVLKPNVEVKVLPSKTADVLATLEKDVLVELLSAASNGWVKVKHTSSGIVGYIPATVLWGV